MWTMRTAKAMTSRRYGLIRLSFNSPRSVCLSMFAPTETRPCYVVSCDLVNVWKASRLQPFAHFPQFNRNARIRVYTRRTRLRSRPYTDKSMYVTPNPSKIIDNFPSSNLIHLFDRKRIFFFPFIHIPNTRIFFHGIFF